MKFQRYLFPLSLLLLLFSSLYGIEWSETDFEKMRRQMVQTILTEVNATNRYLEGDTLDPAVVDALLKVPRHKFVPKDLIEKSYENRPLPIGYGQTISQPYMVAIMTQLLRPKPTDRVLEVGTGSGYQAAILAEIVKHVYTVEIIEPLAKEAEKRVKALGYQNISLFCRDGYYGLPEYAPFDKIIVTAASPQIPPPLIKQLKPAGRMLIPVGSTFSIQQLVLITKDERGKITLRQILPVRFVPLRGKH